MNVKMPEVDFFGHKVSRYILGSNPFNGGSHLGPETDAEMDAWYTCERIRGDMLHAMELGINTTQLSGNFLMWKLMRELKREGTPMQWIANTAPYYESFRGMLTQILASGPIAIYHHGTETDRLIAGGKTDVLLDRLKMLRDAGLPVGLGTHNPATVEYAEEHGWDVDFYMACCYNILKAGVRASSSVTGISNNGESFDEEDVPRMLSVVRSVPKPCLVFKILGASRVCTSPEAVEARFKTVFSTIKPTDCVVVGTWQQKGDQLAVNAALTKKYGC